MTMHTEVQLPLEIEAAPKDITIHVYGERMPIHFVDELPSKQEESKVGLLTARNGNTYTIPVDFAAIVISTQLQVLSTHCAQHEAKAITITNEQFMIITPFNPQSAASLSQFRVGDAIKLRLNGEVITYRELLNLTGSDPFVQVNQNQYQIETEHQAIISGSIIHYTSLLKLYINGRFIELNEEGQFSTFQTLAYGINTFSLKLYANDCLIDSQQIILYRPELIRSEKQIFLWIE